ncbi:MAG: site-2 protease family protein [bacterium]|nr:site-2 protease family protein [bacterium]
MAYFSMLLHEIAHLVSACAIGLRVSHISLYPFGVNLKLKNKITARASEDIILYLSGPAVNLLLALASIGFKEYLPDAVYMYRLNIILCSMNLLPVLPLDGGCILKRIFSGIVGIRRAHVILKSISAVLAAVMTLSGIYAIIHTGYNYSVIIIAVFMIGNLFTQREKYNTEYIRELMFYKNKPLKRVRVTAAYDDCDYRDIAKNFLPAYYSLVCTVDKEGKIKGFKTEQEIVQNILNS